MELCYTCIQFFGIYIFLKRVRKSVRIGYGRATVTGYETSITTEGRKANGKVKE